MDEISSVCDGSSHTATTSEAPNQPKESIMDGQHDKVDVHNIFKPGSGGEGGMGGLGTAAVIAAMGNRNEGGSLASVLPAVLAGRSHDGFGAHGFGAGLIGGVLGGLLFGRRGLLGGEECGVRGEAETRIEDTVFNTQILSKLGTIEGAIPLTASQTENTILQQTIGLNNSLGALSLGTQQGFASVKDSVQNTTGLVLGAVGGVKDSVMNTGTVLLQGLSSVNMNVAQEACSVKSTVVNQTERILAALSSRFQLEDSTKINELNARVIELQSEGRRNADTAELRMTINNNATAISAQQQGQAQAQQQQQQQAIFELGRAVSLLVGDIQAVKQGQVIFNSGVMAGSGTQTAANTKVA